jgi:hypothetical protein
MRAENIRRRVSSRGQRIVVTRKVKVYYRSLTAGWNATLLPACLADAQATKEIPSTGPSKVVVVTAPGVWLTRVLHIHASKMRACAARD